METILEYYIINPLTKIPIDYKSKSITINHNIEYIMVTIKKVVPMTLGLPEVTLLKPDARIAFSNDKELLTYLERIKKQLDEKHLDENINIIRKEHLLEYGSNYFIIPLAIYKNKVVLGVIILSPIAVISDNVIASWNLLSNIASNNSSFLEEFDILAGILAFTENLNHIPKELKRYFINAHNYLPKLRVIRIKKKDNKNFFRNSQSLLN